MNEPDTELWELISSHTARRSFATNNYKKGYPIELIMKMTGHKSQRSFYRYIKVSNEDAADLFVKEKEAENKLLREKLNGSDAELGIG